MNLRPFSGLALAAGLLLSAAPAAAQETAPPPPPADSPSAVPTPLPTPTPVPAPSPSASAPTAPPPGAPSGALLPTRLSDPPSVRIETLPPENPFGLAVESPAALPAKPTFVDQVVEEPLYAAVRVDRSGKPGPSRRVRDPIPSLAAETKKSFERWVFEPGRQAGQPVDTWASVRVDLRVEVKSRRIEQIALTPVTPTSPLPVPLEWPADTAWYEGLSAAAAPTDGTVPVEALETLAIPKKTKWDADSYKGPFSVRLWVRITAAGRVDRAIPLQASDPVLLSDFRRQIAAWQFHPARSNGQAVDSWAELAMAGQISFSVDVKQISNLRKSLPEASSAARPGRSN